jgi:TPR repeat protein
MAAATMPTSRQEDRQLQRAASLGETQAQCRLALCHLMGHGVAEDRTESVRLSRLAAAQGYAPAQSTLAECYAKGEGVPQDTGEAARWWRLAAEQGDSDAQYNLALCCDNGEGVPRDYGEAARWYRLAVDQGDVRAAVNLGRLLLNGDAEEEQTGLAAAARLVAGGAQQEEDENAHEMALLVLRGYMGQKEVVSACCVGCGAKRKLLRCSKCDIARFCGAACLQRMWPEHKSSCKLWRAADGAASSSHGQ